MSDLPDKLSSVPAAFVNEAKTINALIDWGKPLDNLEGKKGIKITKSDSNIVFESDGGNVAFNGTLSICINGTIYKIDIPFDKEKGPYTGTATYPIQQP